jgi:hypothetical protein
MIEKITFWSFGFRYCLGFSASDLGFNPWLSYAPREDAVYN